MANNRLIFHCLIFFFFTPLYRMKEERLQRKSEGSEVLAWVGKLGKIEDRRKEEKRKALLRSKIFEEQVWCRLHLAVPQSKGVL